MLSAQIPFCPYTTLFCRRLVGHPGEHVIFAAVAASVGLMVLTPGVGDSERGDLNPFDHKPDGPIEAPYGCRWGALLGRHYWLRLYRPLRKALPPCPIGSRPGSLIHSCGMFRELHPGRHYGKITPFANTFLRETTSSPWLVNYKHAHPGSLRGWICGGSGIR